MWGLLVFWFLSEDLPLFELGGLFCLLEENGFLIIMANKSCSLILATWYLSLLSDHLLLLASLAGSLF